MVSFGFEKVACLVRELNFSPQGYKVIAVIWMSFKCHLLPVVRNVSKCHLSYLSGNKKYHLICQKCVRLQKCQQMIFHARKFLYQLKLHRFMTEKMFNVCCKDRSTLSSYNHIYICILRTMSMWSVIYKSCSVITLIWMSHITSEAFISITVILINAQRVCQCVNFCKDIYIC